ncbi:ubiquitin carboxyl-terminal hydrolase 34 [Hetaerina americana]|uniref:ubiquitin carboxyl-terminal hydrolase 34 n=1 Tax=Hetaerina americana TaxID=62018 RepID=UPI003A7F1D38
MCDVCADFVDLLQSYAERVSKEINERPIINKSEFEVVFNYLQSWSQRQCMCCFRDVKNFERFNLVIQSIICLAVSQLRELHQDLVHCHLNLNNGPENNQKNATDTQGPQTVTTGPYKVAEVDKVSAKENPSVEVKEERGEGIAHRERSSTCEGRLSADDSEDLSEVWGMEEREKLFQFLSKIFLLNFPLYVAYKHSVQSKVDELSQQEAANLSAFCDLHDPEIPVYLLRNVCLFCKSGGVRAMTFCFEGRNPENLPVNLAHTMMAVICNLKLWLNFRSIVQLFVPLRSKVLRYMCCLVDKDLRLPGIKTMADFMWSAVKDPLESPLTFDRDGLDLAFKYFTSPTLTMRLTGIAQINSNINLFNEMCNNDSIIEVENVGQNLANWLIENQIISHIFGPNLHVEVIKQSHIILSFLAMEGKIMDDHIDIIWQASQLKHCSKQVHDLLPPLIKNLEAGPVLHLYGLLCKMEPKDHTEQSLYLASALIKFIWTSGGTCSGGGRGGLRPQPMMGGMPMPHGNCGTREARGVMDAQAETSSSENSVSVEASNSEDEQPDSSQPSEGQKSPSEGSDHSCQRSEKLPLVEEEKVQSDGCFKSETVEVDSDKFPAEEADGSSQVGMPLQKQHVTAQKEGEAAVKEEGEGDGAESEAGKSGGQEKGAERSVGEEGGDEEVAGNEKDGSADADGEKSGGEESTVDGLRKKKKVYRKRKSGSRGTTGSGAIGGGFLEKERKRGRVEGESEEAGGGESSSSAESSGNAVVIDEVAGSSQVEDACAGDAAKMQVEMSSLELDQQVPNVVISEVMEEAMSEEEGSYSSRMSNKSEKNMADFDGEESGCEDELVQLAARARVHIGSHMAHPVSVASYQPHLCSQLPAGIGVEHHHHGNIVPRGLFSNFRPEDVCLPGSTLIWDLLQDDKIVHLGEGLALEAEKALYNLLCFNTERVIRMKFIEGCLENLAKNQSVVVSLRLLPKLFASFQQFRGMDTHRITVWADQEHSMMSHFFNNLTVYMAEGSKINLYTHQTEVQVRLQFLTSIYSAVGSADDFRLSVEQVDVLWDCLASDQRCSDDLFTWFLAQCRWGGRDATERAHHALGPQTLEHLYLRKLPMLRPESMGMTALGLFQRLCDLARPSGKRGVRGGSGGGASTQEDSDEIVSEDGSNGDEDGMGMDHMWKIALRADSTDVSISAIQYLNAYYVGHRLEHEREFVTQCMAHLAAASADLEKHVNEEASLLCIQRALLLLRTHLETFRKRYAYHLRRWELEDEGTKGGVSLVPERVGIPLRILIRPAGNAEKVTLELTAGDYIADLRAEVTHWWESMQRARRKNNPTDGTLTTQVCALQDGPIRMITQGQELTTDFDEKTLHEVGLKDLQLVFISTGVARPRKAGRRYSGEATSSLPPPPKESLPTTLLLQPPYFDQLFSLMQTLGCMEAWDRKGHHMPHTKAQVLSRRVWDILALLPTSPTILRGFRDLCSGPTVPSLRDLLDPEAPQRLMYSLRIVECLCRPVSRISRNAHCSGDSSNSSSSCDNEKNSVSTVSWSQKFIKCGGLRHLFDIFMSGVLQRGGGGGGGGWDWQLDCLASLLGLLWTLGTSSQLDAGGTWAGTHRGRVAFPSSMEEPGDALSQGGRQRGRGRAVRGPYASGKVVNGEYPAVLSLEEPLLQMMDVKTVLPRLTNILCEVSLPRDPNQYETSFWGRAQVVHHATSILVSWAHSEGHGETVREALLCCPHFPIWLRRLVLEDPEPAVRREACTAVYRLCLGPKGTSSGILARANVAAAPVLALLLQYLQVAEGMRPSYHGSEVLHHHSEDGKEAYGPACRDYFWLLCRLVDGLPEDVVKESIEDPQDCPIDLEGLAKKLMDSIISREFLETRHNTVEDDGLIGLINLMSNVLKHNPPFKDSKECQDFLVQVFKYLFSLPNPRKRHVPKCKSRLSRSSAYDLLVEMVKGCPENYRLLHEKLLLQHQPDSHAPYPWDYWPHEDGRSDCGYVGLTNLGATCYMASCMQHLYMMPQARLSILSAQCSAMGGGRPLTGGAEGDAAVEQGSNPCEEPRTDESGIVKVAVPGKHEQTLREMQRMFAYLMESERKAYNPRSFCRVYTMDHQPLNTGEQKDMAEFFIDLVSKLEEMTPELKKLVKTLFCGVISNNVVSLDCPHVSRTLEEFYTVRCQVADMRNLYESLDEVTVKDTLEGDNMYTCSQCGKKVRAEKRACFKKLPHILCFNTMRYTFNMVTMTKEKVNTHFSFPLRLNMSGYMEKHLLPQHYQEERQPGEKVDPVACGGQSKEEESSRAKGGEEGSAPRRQGGEEGEHCEYDLIGVTVHTGTADGGHYYSFIRDRSLPNADKWFLFNDAEVKPFDPDQIAAECFGGEMTSKTYDSVTDKFMDFSFEKTNSAYMLFYEWCGRGVTSCVKREERKCSTDNLTPGSSLPPFELSKELEDWIWRDNMHFLRDKNIFEHTYFHFMWQICGHVPQTLPNFGTDITEMAARLSTSFFVETFIHAKEKPTMVQWVELLTKQFNSSQAACEWFLEHMATNDCWPVQVLVRCPNQMVRQMFHRLCIHVIQRLRHTHAPLYLKPLSSECGSPPDGGVGERSCVTRFIKMLLSLLEHGAKPHMKHLTEYFAFLYDFGKMGEEESQFLIGVSAISAMVNFYLGQKMQEHVEVVSEGEDEDEGEEGEEEDDAISLPNNDKSKPASLDKMIALVAVLVEKSRGEDHRLGLLPPDLNTVAGGKGFPFLYQQIKDNINLHQTRNLIYALTRWNERLATHIVGMIFQAIIKHTEVCQPFFKLLTLMMEGGNGAVPGLPCFTQLVLQRVWEAAEACPQSALDWLAVQAPRNKLVHAWVLQSLDTWVEHFLISHANQRVRAAAAYLLVSLVPSVNFRQGFRAFRGTAACLTRPGDPPSVVAEATPILHRVYSVLLRLLKPARLYIDIQTHGTSKLTAYFTLLSYCAVSRVEKLMFGQYFLDLWQLFHPKLAEPSIPVHHNKQAVLLFWNQVCNDCPENVQLILQNPHVTKNIAFNYILADHNDQDVVQFNRAMLPAYYGLLRTVCEQSRGFCRHLAAHQNIHWAFKNITPYPTQYSTAVEELFKLMQLFVLKRPDSTEQELREIATFRRQTLQLYLEILDGRSCWATLVTALRTLIDNDDDRLFVIYNNGFQILFESLHTLHVMHHEATACHVGGDLQELLAIMLDMARCLRTSRDGHDGRNLLLSCKDWADALRKLATLLNTYNPPEMRMLCIELLKEMLLLLPGEVVQVLGPLLSHCHAAFQDGHRTPPVPVGPYFPHRGGINHHRTSLAIGPSMPGPRRPMVQMAVPHSQLESAKGLDEEYDEALLEVYTPYHQFVDVMCRLAVNNDCMTETLVGLSAMLGFEGVPLHLTFFAKLWLDIYHAQHVDRKYISMLTNSNYFVDYVEAVLLDERTSLNNGIIYNFLCIYFSKVASHVLNEQTCNLISSLVSSLTEIAEVVSVRATAFKLNGDLRALSLVYGSGAGLTPPPTLDNTLTVLLTKAHSCQRQIEEAAGPTVTPTTSTTQEVGAAGEVGECDAPSKKRKVESGGATSEKEATSSPSSSSTAGGSGSPAGPSKTLEECTAHSSAEGSAVALQGQPRSAFCVNWVEVLVKTIMGLLNILGKKG